MNKQRIEISSDYCLLVDGKLLHCAVDSIGSDGEVCLRGNLPDTRKTFLRGTILEMATEDDGEDKGKIIFSARVLRSEYVEATGVITARPEEIQAIELYVRLVCDITYCEFFVPLDD